MRLKNFTGQTLAEARELVRQELGDDAEVTGTRDLGSEGYQITCVLPDPVDAQISQSRAPEQAYRALRWHRTPQGLSQSIASAVEDKTTLEECLASALSRHFPQDELDNYLAPGSLLTLVGPPGMGKTVMAAKLAVHALLRGTNVALLCCDHLRQGASTQLKSYAERLQCSYYDAPTARIPFLALISRLQHEKMLVLADTSGCNPFNREEILQLKRMVMPEQMRKLLVLSSALDRQSAILLTTAFKSLELSAVIGTSLDYEPRLGGILGAAHQIEVPIIAWSRSPRVNDPLVVANASVLAKHIIRATPESAYHIEEEMPQPQMARPGKPEAKQEVKENTPAEPVSKSKSPHSSLEEYDFSDISLTNNLITIGSGKGGVGKTWFTITLAQALARLRRRVLVFDGDLGLANIDIQLGLTPEKDLGEVVQGRLSLRDTIMRYEPGGFDVIAGRSGTGTLSLATPRQIHGILADLVRVGTSYDHVLLDLGAGIDPIVRLFSYYGRITLLLTTEDPTSVADTYAFIKVLSARRPKANMHVVMNMVESISNGMQSHQTLQRAVRKFLSLEIPLAGVIERDRSVIDAIRHQSALLTRSPLSSSARTVVEIASSLVQGNLQPQLEQEEESHLVMGH